MLFYMNFSDKYYEVNSSFKNKCIYKVGESQGLFSEINYMIYAMLYCLEHKIQFILTSVNANYAPDKGWEEFFLPFCDQNFDKFHAGKLNVRHKNDIQKSIRRSLKALIYKKNHRVSLTQDIFEKLIPAHAGVLVNIPELNWQGKSNDLIKPLVEMVWRFNPQTRIEIDTIIDNLKLPSKYVAMQIRRGDKITIEKNIDAHPDKYMEELSKLSHIKNVLILCDDCSDLSYLKENYKDYKFYSICQPIEKGYSNENFQNLCWEKKRKMTIDLFATIDAMIKAELFLSTGIANPQLFIKMFIDKEKFHVIEHLHEEDNNEIATRIACY